MSFFFSRGAYSTAVRFAAGLPLFCNPPKNCSKPKNKKKKQPSCEEEQAEWEKNWDWREGVQSKGANHYLLIRHGQYYERGANRERLADSERVLSPKGRTQAYHCGRFLRRFFQDNENFTLDDMVSSDMMRAKQTAQLAHEELRTGPGDKVQGSWFNGCGEPKKIKAYMGLAETVPYFTLPMLETAPEPRKIYEINENEDCLKATALQIFRRPLADGNDEKNSVTLVFCHANVIRYLMLHLLQMPRERWHRFSLHHCSITWLKVDKDGYVTCRTFGDASYLDDCWKSKANAIRPRVNRRAGARRFSFGDNDDDLDFD